MDDGEMLMMDGGREMEGRKEEVERQSNLIFDKIVHYKYTKTTEIRYTLSSKNQEIHIWYSSN